MPQVYQIVIPILCFLCILYAVSSYRRKKKSFRELAIWFLFWGGIAYIAFFPLTIEIFAKITGIRDGIKALALIGIAVLFVIVMKLILIVEKTEQEITKLVRMEALKEVGREEGGDM